ncbi:MAG: PAS domain S-box protein [Phycisphaerae bacterium]|nr:PAS domain S-box protein [Phycisphaerae bacterium]
MVLDNNSELSSINQNNELYKAFFENNGTALFIIHDKKVILSNPGANKMFGANDLTGRYPPEEFSPEFQPDGIKSSVKADDLINLALDGQPQNFEWLHIKSDGQEFFGEVSLTNITIDGVIMTLAIVMDISKRKAHEQELIRQKEFTKSLLFATPTPVYYKDINGKYLGFNKAAEDFFGLNVELFTNKTVKDMFSDIDADFFTQKDKELFDSPGEKQTFEYKLQNHAGQYRDLVFHRSVFKNNDGDIEGLVGFFIDVTEQKKYAQAIKALIMKSSSKGGLELLDEIAIYLSEIIESSMLFIGIPDSKQQSITMISQHCSIEQSFDKIFDLQDIPCQIALNNKVTIYPKDVQVHFPNATKLKEMDIQGYIGIPLTDHIGKPQGILCAMFQQPLADAEFAHSIMEIFALHISAELDRINLGLEREKLLKDLASKNNDLENIIYISSHDLRTPLINIQGYSREIDKDIQGLGNIIQNQNISQDSTEESFESIQARLNESLQYIESSTAQMDTLLTGLLKLCRISRAPSDIRTVNVNKIITNIIDTLQYRITRFDVEVKKEKLPSCIADYNQLSQLITNLIENAIKYRHPDRKLEININGSKEGDSSIYRIKDNGLGISANHIDKIFELFYRNAKSKKNKGDGLGLTIASKIAKNLNGSISVNSELEIGSEFIVTMPNKKM